MSSLIIHPQPEMQPACFKQDVRAMFEAEVVDRYAGCQLWKHLSVACQAQILATFIGCFAAEFRHLRLATPRYFFYTLHEDTVFLFMPIPEIPKKAPDILYAGWRDTAQKRCAGFAMLGCPQTRFYLFFWPNAKLSAGPGASGCSHFSASPASPRIEYYVLKLMPTRLRLLAQAKVIAEASRCLMPVKKPVMTDA